MKVDVGHVIIDRTFTGVSAVGIGHLKKDVVLVFPADADHPKEWCEELGTGWTQLLITKEHGE